MEFQTLFKKKMTQNNISLSLHIRKLLFLNNPGNDLYIIESSELNQDLILLPKNKNNLICNSWVLKCSECQLSKSICGKHRFVV